MACKMKADIKRKWVSALRSGKYKKTTSMLHKSGGGFCCLGVLTDLFFKEKGIKDGWEPEAKGQECGVKVTKKKGIYLCESYLPMSVSRWAGVKYDKLLCDNPKVSDATLSDHNDGINGVTPKSFAKIADMIEKEL